MSSPSKNVTTFANITCPFCSLLCDDLTVTHHNGQLKLKNRACQKAKSHFEAELSDLSPAINGKKTSVEEAIKYTARILRKSRQPLFAGLGTDVAGMGAVMKLADMTGGMVDHMHSNGAMLNMKVIQDQGWMMTTMGEVKNRADMIIMIGTDGATNYPRFFERVINNKYSLFTRDNGKKNIVFIGDKSGFKLDPQTRKLKPDFINCTHEELGDVISIIHSIIVGHDIEDNMTRIKLDPLRKLSERMSQSKYGVIVWAPSELEYSHAELTIQAISELIKYLNRKTRFAGFSLSGNDGGISALNVCAWQSGYPIRVGFNKGYPEYDPYKYSTRNVLKTKEVDALIWISSFNSDNPVPVARIPTIVLSSKEITHHKKPDVFIPVGTPGLDNTGQLFRTDNIVALPLKKLRDSGRPGVSHILNSVADILGAD